MALFEKRALVWSEKGVSIRRSIGDGDGPIRERKCDLPTLPRLITDATQCPFLASLVRSDGPVIGCLIYPESGCHDLRLQNSSDFTCRYFSCYAREILTDDEIIFAARLMADWYYYSLFINDIPVLKDARAKFKTPEAVPPDKRREIMKRLEMSLVEQNLRF